MNILLIAISAKYIHSNPAVFSLKACTGEYSGLVNILEFTINQQPSFLLQEIYKKRPDVIAFSCYIWNRTLLDGLIPDLHQILPDADIWAGGPEVSYDAPQVIQNWQLRGVMTGAGEGSFYRLVSAYAKGTAASLPAILRQEDAPRITLAQIPFWQESIPDLSSRIIYYESSRGCPFSCSYCLSSIEKTMDFRPVSQVCRELDFFLERRVPQVKFTDRTFNCKKAHALPILSHILEHDNGITNFHFEISADLLDGDYFALLRQMRPGAVQLEIGVQSVCARTITEIGRSMDFDRVSQAVRLIHSWNNIHIHLDLIAGLPFEDFHTFEHSFNEVYALQPQQLQLGFLKVLKGSGMERQAAGYGLCHTSLPPYEVLCTRWLSYEDICRLKQVEAVLETYYNSGQFAHALAYLERFFDTPFSMYESLGRWHETHGCTGIQPSRLRKYEILLEFGTGCADSLAAFKEYLVYDLYLREHMKNRPGFAPSLDKWKNTIHDILQEEARTHAWFPKLAACNYRALVKALHAEVFETIFEKPSVVLFCYETRSPLTHNCMTRIIPLAE